MTTKKKVDEQREWADDFTLLNDKRSSRCWHCAGAGIDIDLIVASAPFQ